MLRLRLFDGRTVICINPGFKIYGNLDGLEWNGLMDSQGAQSHEERQEDQRILKQHKTARVAPLGPLPLAGPSGLSSGSGCPEIHQVIPTHHVNLIMKLVSGTLTGSSGSSQVRLAPFGFP